MLFLFILNGTIPSLIMLSAAFIHEAGHIICALSLGASIKRLDLELWGGKIVYGGASGYSSECAIAISGIVLNGLAGAIGLIIAPDNLYFLFFALSNFAYAALNLLPIKTLDGFVALSCLLNLFFTQEKADAVLKLISAAFMLVFCAALCLFAYLSGLNSSIVFLAFLTVILLLERQ